MLTHYLQLSSSIQSRLFGSMQYHARATACLSSGAGSIRSIFFVRATATYKHLYVRSDTTMDPMCVRAANALVRLCICPGSSELSIFA